MRSFLLGVFVASCFWLTYHSHAQTYVIVNGLAQHLGHESHCNNHLTPGLGYEHSLSGNWRVSAGVYDNSNCRTSWYLAGAWLPLRYENWRLGTISGLVTGYRVSPMPAGGLVAAWEGKRYGLNLIFIPPVGDSGNVAWLQLKIHW